MVSEVPPGSPAVSIGDAQLRLMTKVARMYHERGLRQADIADALHISQARTSRLLKRAAEVGIVRTVVASPAGIHGELEDALEQRFGLLEAVVVDVEGDESDIVHALGSATADHLESTLTGGDRVGVSSWSQTLLTAVDRMRPLRSGGADEVVQLLGGMGAPGTQAKAQRLLGSFAGLVGAAAIHLQAPGLVASRRMRDSLLADPSLAPVVDAWSRLTMALVGIGSLTPSPLLAQSGNAFGNSEVARLSAAAAVGDICYHFFDAEGVPVTGELDDRIVSIPLETFRAIPRRVGIAGGERKHVAIRASVEGGWVNVLITDVATAQHLVGAPAG